jgi:hypothetical protein
MQAQVYISAHNDGNYQGSIDVAIWKLVWKQNINFVHGLDWLHIIVIYSKYNSNVTWSSVCIIT